MFKPQAGKVQSGGTGGIALWMLDADRFQQSLFSRPLLSGA